MKRSSRTAWWIALGAICTLPLVAASRSARAAGPESTFNGGRAFEDLKHIVSYGPRPSGSKPLSEARKWIVGQLERMGYTVEEDMFEGETPFGPVTMFNLRVVIPGTSPKVVMLAGHYDTKRFEEFNFDGANDGGSSAAFLLEMARVLNHRRNKFTTWLVFFDGEEAMVKWTDTDSLYGSRHLVQKLTSSGELGRIQAMILVDMIGDSKLNIYRDANSTDWLSDVVFKTARRLGYGKNFIDEKRAYEDDHLPFVNAGVSSVDIIDLDYGPNGAYWHTFKDTLDKCSPLSLTIAGQVVLGTIEELEKSPRIK